MAQVILRSSKWRFLKVSYITRTVTTSCTLSATGREPQGGFRLPRNPNKSGPLTNLPDYSFMDGKVTPLGANQKKRLLQQRDLATKIVTLSKEMDFALERYNKLQEGKKREKQAIIDRKFKPKGHLLLAK